MTGGDGPSAATPRSHPHGAVLLVSHGTVDQLDDLTAFVTNVLRGRAPPAKLVSDLRSRYEAIGGVSPLNATSALLARKLGLALGVHVAWANRLWRPYTRDVLAALASEGARRVAVLPLAPFSTHVYEADARLASAGLGIELACATDWGQNGKLVAAFSQRIEDALGKVEGSATTTLVMTAHSLPRAVVDAGDPYERLVRSAADTIAAEVNRRRRDAVRWTLAFQSQGMSGGGGSWLGPDIPTVLDEAKARGATEVVFAPIGFLSDHVETLYDLDIEAARMARDRGLGFARAKSLDASTDFVEVLADLARPLLGRA